MGIYARPDSPFWWMWLEGHKPESTKVLRDAPDAMSRKLQRQQAEDIYRAKMTDLARAQHDLPALNPVTITFNAYADWYDDHHIAKHRGADRERYALKPLRAHFGAMDLTAITGATVTEYETARLADGVTANNVNREVAVLKSMLVAAVPTYLKASPLKGRKLLRVVKPKKRIVRSPDEEARILAELRPIDQVFYIVGVDSLMRLSNLINLRRDEDKGTHFDLVDSKTGPYTVPISRRSRKALDSLPPGGEYYFPHRRRAKTDRDRRGAVRTMLKRACARAGVPYGRGEQGITFHTATRATGATRMLRKGIDLRTVQQVGNWSDLRAMQEYLHTDDQLARAAVNAAAPTGSLSKAMKEAESRAKARRVEQARKAGQARQAKARLTRRSREHTRRKLDQ